MGVKSSIICECVNNIKEFGYSNVNKDNIFTDEIYSRFFKRILKSNLGKNSFVDCAIDELLKELK